MSERRERMHLLREGHMLGAGLTMALHRFVHPSAAAVYVLLTLVLWLWSLRWDQTGDAGAHDTTSGEVGQVTPSPESDPA